MFVRMYVCAFMCVCASVREAELLGSLDYLHVSDVEVGICRGCKAGCSFQGHRDKGAVCDLHANSVLWVGKQKAAKICSGWK